MTTKTAGCGDRMILLVTNKWDLSVDYVVEVLHRRKLDFMRLNTEDLLKSTVTVSLPEQKFLLPHKSDHLDLNVGIKSILFRRPGRPMSDHGDEAQGICQFVDMQWSAFLDGFYSLQNVVWVNHPLRDKHCEAKILQLKRASDLGFRIPRTCITSDKETAEQFLSEFPTGVVCKALGMPLIEEPEQDYFIFSQHVASLKNVESAEVQMCPLIFQEKIESKRDVRVTVVGEKVFSAEVLIEPDSEEQLDWRVLDQGISFRNIALPSELEQKCVELVKSFGLNFGALDLVLNENGFYFLEINPAGEWGWLQARLGFPIAEALVDVLEARSIDQASKLAGALSS